MNLLGILDRRALLMKRNFSNKIILCVGGDLRCIFVKRYACLCVFYRFICLDTSIDAFCLKKNFLLLRPIALTFRVACDGETARPRVLVLY